MELIIIDMITSICQSTLFGFVVKECVEDERNKIKLIYMVLGFLFISQLFTRIFTNNLSIYILLPHLLALFLLIVLYRKNIVNALISYTIIYSIIIVFNMILGSLILKFIRELLFIKYINYEKIILYIPQWILIYLCFKYIGKIKKLYTLIVNENFFWSIIIISFVVDFIITFYLATLSGEEQLLKNIIYIIFFMFFVVVLVYFGKVYHKSEQIYILNNALEVKNRELSKIKHDYGAQISYLYGLCLMNRFNDLKQSLKNIINSNETTITSVEINDNNNELLSLALKPALYKGIHVIIKGSGDISSSKMPEIELYRVISNIVNNAIRAMNGKGIIIAKVYEQLGNLIIKIENNGPKIKEEHLTEIFKSEFTTKNNDNKSHGFGLDIVKDLIQSHNGNIYVKSTDVSTEFKIILPIK